VLTLDSVVSNIAAMPATPLPAREQRLEARLLELERLHRERPSLSTALPRAEAGQRIDELLDEIAELQRMIDMRPAETLEDAAVKLRRLSAYVDGGQPARLLAGALGVLERACRWIPGRDRAQRVPEAAGGAKEKPRPKPGLVYVSEPRQVITPSNFTTFPKKIAMSEVRGHSTLGYRYSSRITGVSRWDMAQSHFCWWWWI
jgi:hypothetical protein